MKVKICGITSLADALAACGAGADALGFVFYRKSPRYIEPKSAKKIIAELPPFVSIVGVFVDEDIGRIKDITSVAGIDYAQLHGSEPPGTVAALGRRAIKAFRIKDASSIEEVNRSGLDMVMLDSHTEGYGGSGQRFDYSLIKGLAGNIRFILSGGITPDNVCDIANAYRPYAIDVSSGVEISPGKKSKEKIKLLFGNLRTSCKSFYESLDMK